MVMEKEAYAHGSLIPLAFAIVLAAALLAGALWMSGSGGQGSVLCKDRCAISINTTAPDSLASSISVNADAQTEVAPDKAEISFSVVSRGADPALIQQDNDRTVQAITEAVQALGVPAENIKTVGYSLDRWTEWSENDKTMVDKGYVLTNSVRVVTYRVEQAGTILKLAVQNGANNVDGVSFGLSDNLSRSTYNLLLEQAAGNAGQKAQAMASASGVKIVRLNSMQEGYGYVQPVANVNYRAADMSGAAPVPAQISAGMAKLSASVSASYKVQ